MAGSVFGKIAERVYAKDLRFDIRSAIDSTTNVIPPVKAGEMNEALLVLNDLKVPVQKQFSGQKKKEQWGHTQAAPSAVILQDREPASGTVPSVVGMGAKDAVYLLESKGLKVRLNGVGRVRNQSIASGSRIVKGQTIALAAAAHARIPVRRHTCGTCRSQGPIPRRGVFLPPESCPFRRFRCPLRRTPHRSAHPDLWRGRNGAYALRP